MIERRDLFIGGEYAQPSTDATIEVISPHSEKVIATVPDSAPQDVDRAVAAASAAMRGPWGSSTRDERAAVMGRFLEEYRNSAEEIGTAQVLEMGCPLSQVQTLHVNPAIEVLEYNLGLLAVTEFEEHRPGRRGTSIVRRLPIGVVAAIVPWNGPPMLTMLKLAPALAAGCAIVLKPSPEAPLDAFILADTARAAGIPDGVLSVLPAGRETGEYLVTHPGVDKVAFTGSEAAGRRIASLCGERLTRVTLELGGKSAAIVLPDADAASTARLLARVSFLNNGQVCALTTRILVQRDRLVDFTEAMVAETELLRIGDPMDPATDVGPLVARRQRDRVEGYIALGVEEGATIATGGGRPEGLETGWYVEPTIFVGVDNAMRIAREEIFGPVVAIIPYDDETHAITIANDSDYGLHGSIWTNDIEHGVAVAKRVETGTLAINGFGNQVVAPFGGMKSSGMGREMGPEGLDAYFDYQSILVPHVSG